MFTQNEATILYKPLLKAVWKDHSPLIDSKEKWLTFLYTKFPGSDVWKALYTHFKADFAFKYDIKRKISTATTKRLNIVRDFLAKEQPEKIEEFKELQKKDVTPEQLLNALIQQESRL
jgi:hypothetical protein